MFGALEQAAMVPLAGIIGEWGPRLTRIVLRGRSSPKDDLEVIVQISVFRVAYYPGVGRTMTTSAFLGTNRLC